MNKLPRLAMKIIPLLSMFVLSSSAAELRTLALADIASNGIPRLPGLIYSLPRTRIDIDLHIGVERVETTTTTTTAEGTTTSKTSVQYFARLDSGQKDLIKIGYEDDPSLQFYLMSESSFLVDASQGSVEFFTSSARISSIGVQYDDKTAETITGTIKFLGEVAGLVIKPVFFTISDDSSKTKITIKRESVEGVEARFLKAAYLANATNEYDGNTTFKLQLDDLAQANDQLNAKLIKRLTQENRPEANEPKFKALVAELVVTATGTFQITSAADIVKDGPGEDKFGGTQKKRFFPGIVFTTPSAGSVTLNVMDENEVFQPVVVGEARFPEAGRFQWMELSSKLFATVHPVLTFSSDGGLTKYEFSRLSKTDKAFDALTEVTKQATAALDKVTDAAKAKQSETTAETQKKANLEYAVVKLQGEIDNKKAEITDLEEKLKSAKPEDIDAIKEKLKLAKQQLPLLEKKLDWLKKGVAVTE